MTVNSSRVSAKLRGHEAFEREIRIDGASDERSLIIHPWCVGVFGRTTSEVYLSIGIFNPDGSTVHFTPDGEIAELDKDGWPLDSSAVEDMNNVILDREDFIQGVLAAFPELRRADAQ